MALFQSSVLKKYLKLQNTEKVANAFKAHVKYFHDPIIQKNIRDSKEEQFQEGFLRELFVNVFGYILNPNADFDLTTELKNEKSAKKADGAILKDGKALGVIELKGTNTRDLEKVRQQAFDYKANQTGCVYVITSNFEKIRFYINDAVEFEEFDLFRINEERFAFLYLCLAKDNVLNNIPLQIKEASIQEEEKITNKLYVDYSLFKRELFRDLVKLNMKNEVFRAGLDNESSERNIKHNLFQKSQKLIDRFLFIFFSEDRGLLPPNSTLEILEQWNKLKELDEVVPLYSRFKKYFGYLDKGREGVGNTGEIFAYNGGLFKPDTILDSLIISDELLHKHTKVLAHYDFESQVDVSILGHIFENSLNEIESVNAEIEGVVFEKQKTKRKKDGVFYTPKYITKYIVENTIGKICSDKKEQFGVDEKEYQKNKKGRKRETLQKLKNNLDDYRNWLLIITICDPACGSGAFLNQALDFLIKEHCYIDELETSLLGGGLVFQNIENTILEKNIYGVDINEESVEIAKLSLWLRTAQPRRKLNNLNENIKCGNSLVDNKSVAGDKAFHWRSEFPEVFENGGFDVVISNPPYVNIVNVENESYRKLLKKTFKTFKNKCDLYSLFIEKSILISKPNGELGAIFSNSWMGTSSFSLFREYISKNTEVNTLVELPPGVFDDAVVTTVIMTMSNKIASENHEIKLYYPENKIIQRKSNSIILADVLSSSHYAFSFEPKINLKSNGDKLGDLVSFSLGVKTSDDKRFVFNHKKNDDCLPMLRGKNIRKNYIEFGGDYLWYMPELIKEKAGGRPRVLENFLRPKILIQDIAKSINAAYDDRDFIVNDTLNVIYDTKKDISMYFILGLLNSKPVNRWFSSTFPEGLHIKINQLQEIPIPVSTLEQRDLVSELSIISFTKNNAYQKETESFIRYFQSKFSIVTLNKKLKKWYEQEFISFINEINKAIKKSNGKKLSKVHEMEWMEVFEAKKSEVQIIKAEIDKADKEIDQVFYELYGLTNEEIKVIEAP